MKDNKPTITVDELIQKIQDHGRIESGSEYSEQIVIIDKKGNEIQGECGYIYNTFTVNGLEIVYQEYYDYPLSKPSLVEFSPIDKSWIINKQEWNVVNEDGFVLDMYEIAEIIKEHTDITDIDSAVLGEDKVNQDHLSDDGSIERFTVYQDNAPDIHFSGVPIAFVRNSDSSSSSNFSGHTGYWTELFLYKTHDGKFICQQIERTLWKGEGDNFAAKICSTEEEVIGFFGQSSLAKELYEEAKIVNVKKIDKDNDMTTEKFILSIDGEPDFQFEGELITTVSSRSFNGASSIRWTDLSLYKTKGGKFVCHQIGYSQWQGERTRYSGAVCANEKEVIAFFGQGSLAKELYYEANITNVSVID